LACQFNSFEDKIGLVDLYGFGEVKEDILYVIDFEFFCEVQGHLEDSSKIWTCICDFGVVFVHDAHATYLLLLEL
jgi:hypothetical protein